MMRHAATVFQQAIGNAGVAASSMLVVGRAVIDASDVAVFVRTHLATDVARDS
jgi:NAD/NADP transhydrogenase alpha subunit